MPLTEYELERQRRMEENKKRLMEFGVPQMMEEMQQANVEGQAARKKRKAADKAAESLEPTRRSKRTEGRERPVYAFEAERGSGGSRPPRDGPLVKEGECQEVYGVHHVLALGTHELEWEMFTDGYNSAGERIYDSDKGLSCHQCRQKTLGQRTSCSRCKSGLGVLCGDCLFARYGEHVEEANANKNWVCPCCRDLCNCSRHRKLRKWEATGQLHRSVKSRGYLSVAHYLVLNKAGSLEAKRAALVSGFCPPELAEKLEQEVKELEVATAEAAAAAPVETVVPASEGAAEDAAPSQPAAEGAKKGPKASGSSKRTKPASGGREKPAETKAAKAAAGDRKGKNKTKGKATAAEKPAGSEKRRSTAAGPPTGPPAAAAGVLETSGASGSGAVAAAEAGGPAGEVTAVVAAVEVVVAAAAKGRGKGGKEASTAVRGSSTLEAVVLAAPSRRRAEKGRN